MKTTFLFFWCFFSIQVVFSQNCKTLFFTTVPQTIDSLSLIAESIIFEPQVRFIYNPNTNQIQVLDIQADSLKICYKTFPFLFSKKYFFRKNSQNADSLLQTLPQNIQLINTMPKEELFSSDQLQKSGSLTRGISFGNKQDVFLNSALNLQLEGQITDDLHLQAVLTDQNIPFQPQGNTQQIQDFDQILLRLRHPYFELLAGDVVLQNNPKNYFLKYYKNILGGVLQSNWGQDSSQFFTKMGISAAKGQFTSQIIQGVEGVQGAYRLRGANNEAFIIVLANSEKVYLDAKLLERGFDKDYTIDYNTAEITFTNRVLITGFSRIRADFEYSSQQFSRTILNFEHRQSLRKWHFSTEFYREKDSPQNSFVSLDSLDKNKLAESDSNIVFVNAAKQESNFIAERILYTKKDTIFEQKTYQIFVKALPNSPNFWNVVFSELGQNKGNYQVGENTANGKAYVWVAPQNGVPQGSYEPVRLLTAPNQKQLLTASLFFKDSTQSFFVETAFSNNDQNLFSKKNTTNEGFAVRIGFEKKHQKKQGFLSYFANFEYDSPFFRGIDRFRSVDFERDWASGQASEAEKIGQAGFRFERKMQKIHYQISFRNKNEQVNGFQHNAYCLLNRGNWFFENQFFRMDNSTQKADWTRNKSTFFYKNTYFKAGYSYEIDQNIQKDSLWKSQMYFEENQFYIQSGDSSKLNFRVSYQYRKDKKPEKTEILNFSEAQTFQANLSWQKDEHFWQTNLTYRKIHFWQVDKSEENLMSRLDWRVSFLQKMFRSELSLSNSTGQELQKVYNFLKVSTGIGTHTWRDDNQNQIAELNEFYEALNPDERNYIKIFTPSNQYIPAFLGQFSYRLSWILPKELQNNNWTKFIAKFQNIVVWNIQNRTTKATILERIFVFLPNQTTLSQQNTLRNTLFFNRNHRKWGFEANFRLSEQKQLLTNGFEAQKTSQYDFLGRWLLNKNWTWQSKFILLNKSNASFLENRNYFLESQEYKNELIFQKSASFRFLASFSFKNKDGMGQTAKIQESQVSGQWVSNWVNFTTEIRFTNITFLGQNNTPLAYELLEALQNGKNWVWSAYWQQKIGKGLQLVFRYDGRKSENSGLIHVGRVQVNALF